MKKTMGDPSLFFVAVGVAGCGGGVGVARAIATGGVAGGSLVRGGGGTLLRSLRASMTAAAASFGSSSVLTVLAADTSKPLRVLDDGL